MIVITGGTGTVGSRLVDLLIKERKQVRVFCRDGDKARRMFGDHVEIAVGDLGDPDAVQAALADVERVFLLTTATAEPDAQLQHERNVIAAAKRAGAGRLVKMSVFDVDEHSPMRMTRIHRAAEDELKASGLGFTILRATGFMQNFLATIVDGRFYTCAEDGRVAMVDARDIAAVAAAALTEESHEGKTYTLTGPEAVSHDEVAAILSAATGQDISHVRVPPAAVIEGIVGAGRPRWIAEDLAAQFGAFASGRGAETSGGIAEVTGRKPRSLDEFAREEFATR